VQRPFIDGHACSPRVGTTGRGRVENAPLPRTQARGWGGFAVMLVVRGISETGAVRDARNLHRAQVLGDGLAHMIPTDGECRRWIGPLRGLPTILPSITRVRPTPQPSPETRIRLQPDWFARTIALAQVVATLVVVLLGALLLADQKRTAAVEAGRALEKAYAVKLGAVARGVEDMLKCHEKLRPYATGAGTRLAFQDLKSLGATLTIQQLTTIQDASNELNWLFPPTYSAPLAGTAAAYAAWADNAVLRSRATQANALLSSALADLGGDEQSTDPCYGRLGKHRQH